MEAGFGLPPTRSANTTETTFRSSRLGVAGCAAVARATTYASERLLVGESRVGVGPPLGLGLRLCSRLAGLGRRIGRLRFGLLGL